MEAKIIDLEKWRRLPWDLAQRLLLSFKTPYGYTLVSKNPCDDMDENDKDLAVIGFLTATIEKHLKDLIGDKL